MNQKPSTEALRTTNAILSKSLLFSFFIYTMKKLNWVTLGSPSDLIFCVNCELK